jgi:tetratricopeptide (TPR) repeat protein
MTAFRYGNTFSLALVVLGCLFLAHPVCSMTQLAQKEYLQAKTLEQQKNYTQSLFHLNQAIALDPTDPLLYASRAAVLSQQGEPLKAIENYEKAASLNSQDPMLYFALGQLFEQTNQLAKAKTAYENNLLKNPSYRFPLLTLARVATRQNQPQQAIGYLTDFLQSYPNHWQAKVQLAQAYLQAKQPESAIKLLNELKETDAKRFKESALLGRAYLQANQAQAALEALVEAKRLGEYDTEIAELMGQAYQRLGKLSDAISVLKEAIAGNPEKPTLLLNLAELYHQTNQLPLAIETVQQFLAKEPSHTGAWLALLEWCYKAIAGGVEPLDSRAMMMAIAPKVLADKTLLLTAEDRANVQTWLALTYTLENKSVEAIPLYEALLSTPTPPPDRYLSMLYLAWAYDDTHQPEKALALYDALLTQYKDEIPAESLHNVQGEQMALRLSIANNYVDAQKNEAAIALYDKVLATDPYQPEALLNKALLLQESDPKEALTLINKALVPEQVASLMLEIKAKAFTTQAELATELNETQLALTAFTQLEALAKENPTIVSLTPQQWILAGYAHQQAKQWEQARLAYDAVLKDDPSNGRILYNKGLTYFQQGNYKEAIAPLEAALKVASPEVQAHYSLALIAEKHQRWQDAVIHYKAVKALPENEQKAMGLSSAVIEKRLKAVEAKLAVKPIALIAQPSIKRRR